MKMNGTIISFIENPSQNTEPSTDLITMIISTRLKRNQRRQETDNNHASQKCHSQTQHFLSVRSSSRFIHLNWTQATAVSKQGLLAAMDKNTNTGLLILHISVANGPRILCLSNYPCSSLRKSSLSTRTYNYRVKSNNN
jgi:hypothetical protein